MWPLNAQQIASLVAGSLVGDACAQVSRVVTDSRQPFRGDELFVGLVGDRFDGGRFAQSALSRGARVVLTSRTTLAVLAPGQAHVQVDEPLVALQSLAAFRRRAWNGTLVGITGSNGKTIVKDMLATLLARHTEVYASPQSWNSQVGVALSLLGIHDDDAIAVIECGISQPGEMARLQAMVRPNVGVLVNIGDAHRQTLESEERTRSEKMALFSELKGPLMSADPLCVAELTGRGGVGRMPSAAELDAARDQLSPALASVPHLVMDAALAMAAAVACGMSVHAMAGALRDWRPAPMRLEMTSTPRGVLLINDAYTADPLSVSSALAVLANEKREGKSIAVLGGLAGLGAQAERAHADIGAQVVRLGIDRLVGVGQGGRQVVAGALVSGMAPEHALVADSVQDAALLVDELARNGDRVLLKASRPEGLEEVARIFFAGFAPTRAFVDLDRIAANYFAIREVVGPQVGIMCVVKAFGYGLDAIRMARELERAGASAFAVAFVDEGISLREKGITSPILVQNILPGDGPRLLRHHLTAEVGSLSQASELGGLTQAERATLSVHLKVDTGMGRSGVLLCELAGLLGEVKRWPGLVVDGLMTHLAGSEDARHDAFTREQLQQFAMAQQLTTAWGFRPRWFHACNSAAIGRFPEAHGTMVRAGIGLLGYSRGSEGDTHVQQPAIRLLTRVVSVRVLPAGTTIGYGRTGVVQQNDARIAVVAMGYNDGYPRALSNRGYMTIRGVRCSVVGKVCMDVTMLDVSGVPDVEPGDDVVVFGDGANEPDLHALSALADTIAYELLTRLSGRVRRVYAASR